MDINDERLFSYCGNGVENFDVFESVSWDLVCNKNRIIMQNIKSPTYLIMQ